MLIEKDSNGECEVSAYDAQDPRDLASIEVDLVKSFSKPATTSSSKNFIEPTPELIGISSETYDLINASLSCGKKHLIFYGPAYSRILSAWFSVEYC